MTDGEGSIALDCRMAAPTHQGLYRNTPLVFGGLMGAIALLVAGIAKVCAEDTGDRSSRDAMTMPTTSEAMATRTT